MQRHDVLIRSLLGSNGVSITRDHGNTDAASLVISTRRSGLKYTEIMRMGRPRRHAERTQVQRSAAGANRASERSADRAA
jgi:hypothetical protein